MNAAMLIDDLRETFDNLDRYKINLNPKKCFFGVPGGQVLGYFISAQGIKANPLKIKAVLDMEPPGSLQQVQHLVGRVAALSRFIAKLGEKALPFYQLMKKSEKFESNSEAQDAFDNLKKVLSTSPVLVTPHDREPMLLYIAALQVGWSAPCWSSNERKHGRSTMANVPSTTSVKYSPQPSSGTCITTS
jgi:hypothetical protein